MARKKEEIANDGVVDDFEEFSYNPSTEATEDMEKEVFHFDSDFGVWYNPSKFPEGEKVWFRLIWPDQETRQIHGDVQYLVNLKYQFSHSWKTKDDGSPRWFVHNAEGVAEKGAPDEFYEWIRDYMIGEQTGGDLDLDLVQEGYFDEEGGNDIVQIFREKISPQKYFRIPKSIWDKYCNSKLPKDKTSIRVIQGLSSKEQLVGAVQVSANLDEEGRTHVLKGDKKGPGILNMNWGLVEWLFMKDSGLSGQVDEPGDVYHPYKGIDFWIKNTGKSGSAKYEYGFRKGAKVTRVDDTSGWKDDIPKLVDSCRYAIRTEEAIKVCQVYFGDIEPPVEEEDVEVEDTAPEKPKNSRKGKGVAGL